MGNSSRKASSPPAPATPASPERTSPSPPAASHPTSARTSSLSATKPATPANQVVRHIANNYVIPAISEQGTSRIPLIQAPLSRETDKLCLRVCPQHNSRNGCKAPLCRRLHVCSFWALKNCCQKSNCENDHSFSSSHNSMIVDLFCPSNFVRDSVIIAALQDNHKQRRANEKNLICMYSIRKKCNKKPCHLVHANKTYRWEVHDGSSWVQFPYKLNDFLEQAYCDPSLGSVEFPPFQQRNRLESLLSQRSWNLDFESNLLISKESSLPVRRLSTPSDIASDVCLATRWLWYWQDDDGSWKQYDSGIQKFFILSLSDQFEFYQYLGRKDTYNFQISRNMYELSLSQMMQTNKSTGKQRKVRRRPLCIVTMKNGQTKFQDLFITLPNNKKFIYFPILTSTSEFAFIEKMMKQSLPSINITSIKRIQNDHLWKAYQNKKKLLLSLYNGDVAKINEQYLFHGTKHSVIDQISSDNLDWKLYGRNVGHVYGKGLYFTNKASVSDAYSETKLNEKAVFVVFVLVGTMTVGNRDLDIPPVNPETGRHFDTTCNHTTNSTIFVKYDKDEYYPAYIVKYRHWLSEE